MSNHPFARRLVNVAHSLVRREQQAVLR